MAAQYVREVTRIWNLRRNTMINAVKKIINGDTPLASISIDTGAIASAELAASAVTAAKIMASAVNANGLKYGSYTFSLAGDAVGAASAASATFTVAITNGAKVIGMYTNKRTSYNIPVLTHGANSVKVSIVPALVGSDIVEGVLITIEP
jgi:hypothetical protein